MSWGSLSVQIPKLVIHRGASKVFQEVKVNDWLLLTRYIFNIDYSIVTNWKFLMSLTGVGTDRSVAAVLRRAYFRIGFLHGSKYR